MNTFDMIKYGKGCYDIITEVIPQKIEDGVLTADEMASIIREICRVFDIKAEIRIPQELEKKYFDIVDYEEEAE